MPSSVENPDKNFPRIGIVTPWYGHSYGGAERFIQQFAEQLKIDGLSVEVFTTQCSSPYKEWSENDLPEGTSEINGLRVSRFPVDQRNADLYATLYRNLSQSGVDQITDQDLDVLIDNSINSQALYDYITRHKDEYVWIFSPYMYGITLKGALIAPDRSILIPCLHDEPFAHIPPVHAVFQKIRGIVCLSHPERELILRLYDQKPAKVHFMGCGVHKTSPGMPSRFREKYGIDKDYFLYIGKKDTGKNLHVLIKFFQQFIKDFDFDGRLLLMGPGDLKWVCNNIDRRYITDLGIVETEDEKNDALAGAIALCHPSDKESFSIALMESWLQERPVVVDYSCEVTRNHCQASNGGLFYKNYWEFHECLKLLIEQRFIAAKLGKQGKEYVEQVFSWETVLNRFKEIFKRFFPSKQ